MSRPYLTRLLVWAGVVVGIAFLVTQWVAREGFAPPPGSPGPPGPPAAMPARELAATDTLAYLARAANAWLGRASGNWVFLAQIALVLAVGWGRFGKGLGAVDLIYAESRAVRFGSGVLIGLMFGDILLVQHLDGGEPWEVAESPGLFAAAGDSAGAAGLRQLGHSLLVTWLPLLVLFYVPGAGRSGGMPALGAGLLAAPALVALAVAAAWSAGPSEAADWLARTPGGRAGLVTPANAPQHLLGFASLVVPLAALGLCGALAFAGRVASPVWVIALLVWLANAAYGLILFHFAGLQYVLIALAALLAYVANARHSYKLCLPNMAPEYALVRGGLPGAAHFAEAASAPALMLRSADKFLAEFAANHRRRAGAAGKPKLVVVAASGGGVRAAVWTAAVLEGLEARLGPRFADSVGLIGGASGGMVGAGLYAASKLTPVAGESLARALACDSLWRLMQTYLIRDLPSLFLPFYRDWDRGCALESTWHGNARAAAGGASPWRHTFADLARAERAGLAPALVYTPLLVEDGRRLIISNLDFADLSAEYAPTLGGAAARERLSVSAVEFFRLFPDAHARFEVGTAARLNATFPFVSPSVCLPAAPPRRVVDAGYFDNYGVNLLAAWLHKNRAAVREHTSGVALLELRAFPMELEKNGYDGVTADAPSPRRRGLRARASATVRSLTATATLRVNPPRPSQGAESGGALLSALAGVSTPAEALLAVRSAGAYFRNDQLVGILDEEFNAEGATPFFVRAALDCPGEAALSWAIGDADRDAIVGHVASIGGADTAGLRPAVEGLRAWLGG